MKCVFEHLVIIIIIIIIIVIIIVIVVIIIIFIIIIIIIIIVIISLSYCKSTHYSNLSLKSLGSVQSATCTYLLQSSAITSQPLTA